LDGWTIIGTVASVGGLIVTIFTFLAATGAKEAAEKAKEAARGRSLVEELEMGERRIHEIGTFLDLDQWGLVRLRATELLSICGAVAARWPDKLSVEKKNNILKAQELVLSIGTTVAIAKVKAPTREAVKSMAATQLRASQLISSVLAEALSQQERSAT
jgi:hypothetical protein